MKFDLFPVVGTIFELNRSNTKLSRMPISLASPVFVHLLTDLQPIWWIVFSCCISSWISSSIWAWVAHIVWASLVQFWIKLCVWIGVCKATPLIATVVQIAINPKMPKTSHQMNRLDHPSNLASNREASPAMGSSSQGRWRFIGNHRLCWDRRIKRDSFLKEIEELRGQS